MKQARRNTAEKFNLMRDSFFCASLGNWTPGPWLEKACSTSLEGAEWSHFPLLKLLLAGQYENLRGDKKILVLILFQRRLLQKMPAHSASSNSLELCDGNPVLLPQQSHNHPMFAGLRLPRLVKHTHFPSPTIPLFFCLILKQVREIVHYELDPELIWLSVRFSTEFTWARAPGIIPVLQTKHPL